MAKASSIEDICVKYTLYTGIDIFGSARAILSIIKLCDQCNDKSDKFNKIEIIMCRCISGNECKNHHFY